MARKKEISKAKNFTSSSIKGTKEQRPRCLTIAERGIRTSQDFACLMSTLMSDVLTGRVNPQVANAACNAGGKLIRITEMQYKYGTPSNSGKISKNLQLTEKTD